MTRPSSGLGLRLEIVTAGGSTPVRGLGEHVRALYLATFPI
jgi:hypothetical protein